MGDGKVLQPFGWFDKFNQSFTRSKDAAAAAIAGGNGVIELWDISQFEAVQAYQRGNLNLIEALMMVMQQGYAIDADTDVIDASQNTGSEFDFSIQILLDAGFAVKREEGGYLLLWDKLEARKAYNMALDRENEKRKQSSQT